MHTPTGTGRNNVNAMKGSQASDRRGGEGEPRFQVDAGEGGRGTPFGKRRERPDAHLMPVLNTGSAGGTTRVPRSLSPPLD